MSLKVRLIPCLDVKDGRVVKEEFLVRSSGGMQGFAFNIRRDKFKDPRIRQAFNYVMDFEDMNQAMFFGQYKRITNEEAL